MFTSRRCRLVAAAVMPLALAGGLTALAQSTSSAAGKGAFTTGGHVHGTQAYGAEVITFLPGSGPPLPTGCWFTSRDAFFSTTGNGIFHGTFNKNGHWFTNTYTGTAVILPILFTPETPTKPLMAHPTTPTTTSVAVTTTATPSASGHLRVWFGTEDNRQNGVLHATINFKGTTPTGKSVSMNGHFDVTTNAKGQVTATPEGISCS